MSDDRSPLRKINEDLLGELDPFAPRRGGREVPLQSVIDAILATPNRGKIDVEGIMGLPDQTLRLNTLTFKNQAVLVLEAIEAPFIAIAVKELLLDIKNPEFKAYITRPIGTAEASIISGLKGGNGQRGVNGPPGQGDVNRQGMPGGHGGAGTNGGSGDTKEMPPVFFFVQKLTFGEDGEPGRQFLNLNFQGFRGGDGGDGGAGGNGGNGGDGKAGATGWFECKEGPGRGGDGGNAGQGGRGGDAGDGGSGGRLYLFAPRADLFNFSTANIEPGQPGNPGGPGVPGRPGRRGRGGNSNPPCGAGPDGNDGWVPSPPNFGSGLRGTQGLRGLQLPTARDNSDLF